MLQVPKGLPTLFIAQEFLDALPVHQFQYTEKGWRERLVDINVPGTGGASADGMKEKGQGVTARGEAGEESQVDEEQESDFR